MDKHTYLNKREKERKMLETVSNELEKAMKDKGLDKRIKKHFEKLKIKQEKCERNGHPNAKVSGVEYMPRQVVYMQCPNCDMHYQRGLNSEEQEIMREQMNKVY